MPLLIIIIIIKIAINDISLVMARKSTDSFISAGTTNHYKATICEYSELILGNSAAERMENVDMARDTKNYMHLY